MNQGEREAQAMAGQTMILTLFMERFLLLSTAPHLCMQRRFWDKDSSLLSAVYVQHEHGHGLREKTIKSRDNLTSRWTFLWKKGGHKERLNERSESMMERVSNDQ